MRTIEHQLQRPKFGGRIGAAIGILCGIFLFLRIFGEELERLSFDLPFMLFREPGKRDEAVIVQLDDVSYDKLKQNPSEFDGSIHAKLIRRLKAEGAKVIVFDIVFTDQNPAGDKEFASAIKEHGGVVVAGYLLEKKVGDLILREPAPLREEIQQAVAGWGLAQIAAVPGSTVRQHYQGTNNIPSMAWKAADLAGAAVARDPKEMLRPRWLNYYGPDPFVHIPYYEAVDPNFKMPVSLQGKTVFVGRVELAGYAGAQKEQFRYPWTELLSISPFGVEFHTITFVNLLRGDWQRRFPFWLELLLVVGIGGGLGYWLPNLRPLSAAGAAIGAAILLASIGCVLQLRAHIWFAWMVPVVVQIPLILIWAILFHSIRSYFEAEFLNRSLTLYLSPAQVKQLLANPDLLKPGVKLSEVSILFSDIANFSKISERMLPEDLARLLNDYYETAISAVKETGGTVVNLIGDAILAIWNAPQEQEDHRQRACAAAKLLTEKLIQFDAKQQNLRLRTRVGLHSGLASVGNIGSASHFDYTALGQNVNLASRLEGLNKQLGTLILATRQIQKPVEDQMLNRCVGFFRFKGFDQVAEVFELLHSEADGANKGPEAKQQKPAWFEPFQKGLHCFQRMAFTEATEHFSAVLQLKPNDGPTEFYLKKIKELSATPPPPEWMGEVDLSEK